MSPVRGILNLIKRHSYSQPKPFLSHTHMDFPLLVHFSGKGFVWIILLGNLWEPFQLPVWVFFFFFFRPHGMWGISSPTRAWIHAPCPGSTVLTTGPPRESCGILIIIFFQFGSYDHEADIQLSQNSLFFIFFFIFILFLKLLSMYSYSKYWLYSPCCTIHPWACLKPNSSHLPLPHPSIASLPLPPPVSTGLFSLSVSLLLFC